jgi:hypothetical protein
MSTVCGIVLALALLHGVSSQTESRTGTVSPTASVTASNTPSFTPTSSITASNTPSYTMTPSNTASITASFTPSTSPVSFACPALSLVSQAPAPRPGIAVGYVECAGQGTCVRDVTKTNNGRCDCPVGFAGSGCETCASGLYLAGVCGNCQSGTSGPCRNSSGSCASLDATTNACPATFTTCNQTVFGADYYRKLNCTVCPGVVTGVNSTTNASMLIPCSGHGTCNVFDGVCNCLTGYSGTRCDVVIAAVPSGT